MFKDLGALRPWQALTWAVALGLVVASGAGLWSVGIYDGLIDGPSRVSARANDLAAMMLAPVLLLAAGRGAAGSLRGGVVWIAGLLFAAWLQAGYSLGDVYSDYLPVHVSVTSAAAFAVSGLMLGIAPKAAARRLRVRRLDLWIRAFLVAIVVVGAPDRLVRLAEAIGARRSPELSGQLVLDLAVFFPLMVVTVLWIGRQLPWGTLWGAILTVWATAVHVITLVAFALQAVEAFPPPGWSIALSALLAVAGVFLTGTWLAALPAAPEARTR